jgi:hypothetical protein
MSNPDKPVIPVKPSGIELIFMYICPYCGHDIPVLAPRKTTMARCHVCALTFPVVAVEEKTIDFIKLILANGTAAIDADFM